MDLVPRLRMPCSQAFSNSSFTANDPKLETGEGLGAVQSQSNSYLFLWGKSPEGFCLELLIASLLQEW